MRRKDGAGQPRSLDQPRPPEKSPPKESSREESLREESPLKEFSIEEFSTQAVPLQRGRFALPPPQDFFCPRLTPPLEFLLPDPVGDSRSRDGPSGRRREKSRAKEVVSEAGREAVSETGCEQGL